VSKDSDQTEAAPRNLPLGASCEAPRPPVVTPAVRTCHPHRIRDGANDQHDSYQKN
jgi:hypothetical protein